MSPYVVTLAIDAAAQARFDAERERLFPPGRTEVGAHVTLFHAVPVDVDVASSLRTACDRPAFDVRVADVMSLGRGAAYRLESEELAQLHGVLRDTWLDRLTPQDRQPFRPHVTVQNKVEPEAARATLARLRSGFAAHDVAAAGVDLWRYDGGPWSHLERYAFG